MTIKSRIMFRRVIGSFLCICFLWSCGGSTAPQALQTPTNTGYQAPAENFAFPAAQAKAKSNQPLLPVQIYGQWGFINRTGELVIAPAFEEVGEFVDGRCPARTAHSLFGYINIHGEFVISPQFDSADNFAKGQAKA